jgi:integrase
MPSLNAKQIRVRASLFVIPPDSFKSKRAHVVILNDAAWSIIEEQRGKDPIWVFPHRGKPVGTRNNTAWQNARKKAELSQVRVHDLKHTFGRRLRTAGVPLETRKVLLGHKSGDITSHYSAPELAELIRAANTVLKTQESTLLRVVTKQLQVVNGEKSRKSRAEAETDQELRS